MNLLSNALKFTLKGSVTVMLKYVSSLPIQRNDDVNQDLRIQK